MLVAEGLILVFFPASVALLLHDSLVRRLPTAGRKWMWYGAYCGIISLVVLAANYIQRGGGEDLLTAFQSIRSLLLYGVVAFAAAAIVPLGLSLVSLLFGKQPGKGSKHAQ